MIGQRTLFDFKLLNGIRENGLRIIIIKVELTGTG